MIWGYHNCTTSGQEQYQSELNPDTKIGNLRGKKRFETKLSLQGSFMSTYFFCPPNIRTNGTGSNIFQTFKLESITHLHKKDIID